MALIVFYLSLWISIFQRNIFESGRYVVALDPPLEGDYDLLPSRYTEEIPNAETVRLPYDENTSLDDIEAAVSAGCIPELRTVPLNLTDYSPSCVRLKRCGGCCQDNLQCQPTKVSYKTLKVRYIKKGSVSTYDSNLRNRRRNRNQGGPRSTRFRRSRRARPNRNPNIVYAPIKVVIHEACDCQCRVKKSDCHPSRQKYDVKTCSCVCKQGQRTCSRLQHWDRSRCECRCNTEQTCSHGKGLDHATCKCVDDKLLLRASSPGKTEDPAPAGSKQLATTTETCLPVVTACAVIGVVVQRLLLW